MRIETARTIRGTHGGQHTECVIFVNGYCYAVKGSTRYHVAAHARDLVEGVWLREVDDVETFSMGKTTIETEQDLVDAINS